MVFYLKYRPQRIKDLDSQEVREKLESLLKNPGHAFLFTGPKGLGKTSTARIVAKILNCQGKNREGIEPCNKCVSCVSITKGTNIDVVEIDAASNRGIDEIRDLREKIRLSPAREKKKVYIIDEVHMLTTEAFNALLKTLEEPPSHATLILCTTDVHKVPDTVVSRCQQVKFTKATSQELVRSLTRIAKGEGLNVDKDAFIQIAQLSDGSFRDGAKILEELSKNARAGKITTEAVEKKYKVGSTAKEIETLVEYLLVKDVRKSLALLNKAEEEGIDVRYFTENLVRRLHETLLEKIDGKHEDIEISDITKLLEIVAESYSKIRFSVLPSLPLEIAIVEWGDSVTHESTSHEQPIVNQPDPSVNKNDKILKDLIDAVKPNNFAAAGVLRGSIVESFDGKNMVIATSYKFHKEKLEEAAIHDLIEKSMSQITGNKVKISFALKNSGGDL